MSNNPMECPVCGHTLQFDGDSYYCENCILPSKQPEYSVEVSYAWERTKEKYSNALNDLEDVVNEPSHYKIADVEVIDIIKSALNDDAFAGYLMGNVLKYRLRAGKKGDTEQDIAKALRYEAWLVEWLDD